jgi:hypothetical protein
MNASIEPTPGLQVEWVQGEAVVLDPTTAKVHYLNGPAALAYALIGEYGYERGVQEFHDRFREREGVDEELSSLLEDMLQQGLLTKHSE